MSIQTERQRASQAIAELHKNSFFQRYWQVIGRFLGRGKPTSIWISVAVVMCANLLLGITVSEQLGETQFTTLKAVLVRVMWVTFSYFFIPFFIQINQRMIEFLQLRFVKSLQHNQDVHEFMDWANQWIGRQIPQLLISLAVGIVVAILAFHGIYPTAKFSFGETLIFFVNFFHLAVGFYAVISLLAFALKLKNWNLILFPDNPASSQILFQLQKVLHDFILLGAFFDATLLFLIGLVRGLSSTIIFTMLVSSWLPLIALFVAGNQAFSQQIVRAKYEKLEKLQLKITELSNMEKMDINTIGHIKSLMDYHERVDSSRNSLYGPSSFVGLIGSLSLPSIAALVTATWNGINIWLKVFVGQ